MKIIGTKIISNNRFVEKNCLNCDSKLIIQNKDVLKLKPDVNGNIIIICPICGNEIILRKYFSGKTYTVEEYNQIIYSMRNKLIEIEDTIMQIDNGYRRYYYNIDFISIYATGLDLEINIYIYIFIYINRYEYGNWNHMIKSSEYFCTLNIEVYEFIFCDDMYDYAKYTQTVYDYLCSKLKIYHLLQLDYDLITYIRK